jgi:hypothetical protein
LNLDNYECIAQCPYCKEKRGVSCSREQANSGNPVRVYAIQCDHSWTLSEEESKRVREYITVSSSK